MGVLWDLFCDDRNFGRMTQREINRSTTIIEMEKRISVPLIFVSPDQLNSQTEKLRQEVKTLCQELDNKISHSHNEIDKQWSAKLKGLEGRLDNFSVPVPTVDFTPVQSDINQLRTDQQNIKLHLEQMENRMTVSPPPIPAVSDIPSDLQARLDVMGREIEGLKAHLFAKVQSEQENAILRQQVETQRQRLDRLEEKNEAQAKALEELKKQIGKLLAEAATRKKDTFLEPTAGRQPVPAPPKKPAPMPMPPPSPPRITLQTSWIESFFLSKPTMPKAFFPSDGKAAKAKLEGSIQEIGQLATWAEKSEIAEPAKTSFEKNLRECQKNLQTLCRKFKFDDCDPDAISEELTEKFFKIISEDLLESVMIAVYRGGEKAAGYKEFLKNLNSYLARHGIYTRNMCPGVSAEEHISYIKDPIPKKTSVAADDGKIDEVELLPYFMTYEDEDGNPDTLRNRGRIVRLQYGE